MPWIRVRASQRSSSRRMASFTPSPMKPPSIARSSSSSRTLQPDAACDLPMKPTRARSRQPPFNQKYLGRPMPILLELATSSPPLTIRACWASCRRCRPTTPRFAKRGGDSSHYGAAGCRVLQITPTDIVHGKVIDPARPTSIRVRQRTGCADVGTWQ